MREEHPRQGEQHGLGRVYLRNNKLSVVAQCKVLKGLCLGQGRGRVVGESGVKRQRWGLERRSGPESATE